MSELPPEPTPPPIEPNPAQYVAYPRQLGQFHGDPDRLEALSKGYFGLNWALLGQIVFEVATILVISLVVAAFNLGPIAAYGLVYSLILVGVTWITLGPNRNIAYGMGWKPNAAITASILMSVGSLLCCGLIGFVVMQQIAGSEMKKYGIKYGFVLGFRKKDVQAAIAQLRANQQFMPPPPSQ